MNQQSVSSQTEDLAGVDLQAGIPKQIMVCINKPDGSFKTMNQIRLAVADAMESDGLNTSEVCRLLGIGRSTLYRWRERYK